MDSDYNSIIMGIWLVLGAQLLVLSVAKLFFGTRKQLPLAFLCMVIAMWFFRKFFRGAWEEYYLFDLIMGGRKEIFLGPLILLHLRMLTQTVTEKWVMKHMLVPIAVYATYMVIRLGFPDFYQSIYQAFLRAYIVTVAFSIWTYFYWGLREFKTELKPKLIAKAYNRHLLFFIGIYIYYLYIPAFDMIFSLHQSYDIMPVESLYHAVVSPINTYFSTPYYCLIAFLLFIYSLTETRYFKNLFLARDIIAKEPEQERMQHIDQLVKEHFHENKLFLNTELTLTMAAKTIGVTRKDFNDYLKERESSFIEFVNQLKVAEFKTLIVRDENQVYDMVSVAEKAGFRSKATFNRVFKQLEGITPRDYRRSLLEV